jgi:hypothetical protein
VWKAVAETAVRRADKGVHAQVEVGVHHHAVVGSEEDEVLGHRSRRRHAIGVDGNIHRAVLATGIGLDAEARTHPYGRAGLPAEQVDGVHSALRAGIEVRVLGTAEEVPALGILRGLFFRSGRRNLCVQAGLGNERDAQYHQRPKTKHHGFHAIRNLKE